MKRTRFLAAAASVTAVAALVLGAGCTGETHDAKVPSCTTRMTDPLVLVAQSVPTASQIPCVTAVPMGWKVGGIDVRNGRTTFRLDTSDGPTARLLVVLAGECSTDGATEVLSDEPGTTRWDRLATNGGRSLVRTYTFAGGCVNYEFELRSVRAALVDEASMAVGFISRTELTARANS